MAEVVFQKDVQALIRMSESNSYQPRILKAVDAVNQDQLGLMAKKLQPGVN